MDEPTTALTHREVEHLFEIIRRLAAGGKSFIFVSHKLQEVAQICHRVVVLRNGSKTLDAPMKDLSKAQIAFAMTRTRDQSGALSTNSAELEHGPPSCGSRSYPRWRISPH
jgi:ABC-type sugar transport system ATPase subunit